MVKNQSFTRYSDCVRLFNKLKENIIYCYNALKNNGLCVGIAKINMLITMCISYFTTIMNKIYIAIK